MNLSFKISNVGHENFPLCQQAAGVAAADDIMVLLPQVDGNMKKTAMVGHLTTTAGLNKRRTMCYAARLRPACTV